MPYTPPPPAPSTNDPSNFDARADALMAWFATHVQEQNDYLPLVELATTGGLAADAALSVTDYVASSASSLDVSTGAKTVVLQQSGKGFAIGDQVVITRRGNSSTRLYGVLTGAPSGAGNVNLPVNVTAFEGSGTGVTGWIVSLAALADLPFSASAAHIAAGTSDKVLITPKSLADSMAIGVLTDGATVTPDFSTGFVKHVTIAGNRTIAAPVGGRQGFTYYLFIKQDATGTARIPSWTGAYTWGAAGAPTLSVGANKTDLISLLCLDAATPYYWAVFLKGA